MNLDPDTCYRALASRDARFDGVFFTGVKTTGIYCRPVCRARTPGRDRCVFFARAAEAEREGFRACFRCRPELAPGLAPVDAVPRTAAAAMARIEAGALNEGSLDQLARELRVSTRHLRRAMQAEIGLSPLELAQSHRLAFAKRLLQDTRLPMTEVAFASGFSSVRRFNALFRARYDRAPSTLRHGQLAAEPGRERECFPVRLDYRPPMDWDGLVAFLGPRAVPGVEAVRDGVWRRTVGIGKHRGWVSVEPMPGHPALVARVSLSLTPVLMGLVARLRRLFDLDADTLAIAHHLKALRPGPGMRVPGSFDGFETAVRAILGQQITVAGATTLSGRLAATLGTTILTPHPDLHLLAPTASRLSSSGSGLKSIGLTSAREKALLALARAATGSDGEKLVLDPPVNVESVRARLLSLPGIGEWTAEYICMRALGWPDAFPAGDLGIRKAMGGLSESAARAEAERWRPWRSYAAMHLWTGDH